LCRHPFTPLAMTLIDADPSDEPGSPGVSGYVTSPCTRSQVEAVGTSVIMNVLPPPSLSPRATLWGAPCTLITHKNQVLHYWDTSKRCSRPWARFRRKFFRG
jgi:hypothetical protein